METKSQLIINLREEFNRWEASLATLNQALVDVPMTPSTFSIKDTLAHLHAWQGVSIARLEAAQGGGEPVYFAWSDGLNPDEADVDQVNARIYALYRQQPWPQVYQDWRNGFLRFLDLAEVIPAKDMEEAGKYAWLGSYPLLAILEGSYNHHIEHYEGMARWLGQHGTHKPA